MTSDIYIYLVRHRLESCEGPGSSSAFDSRSSYALLRVEEPCSLDPPNNFYCPRRPFLLSSTQTRSVFKVIP